MKTIPIEQLDEKLARALDAQTETETIGLTRGRDAIAWVVRVPKLLSSVEPTVSLTVGPDQSILALTHQHRLTRARADAGKRVFGAGKGSLTVLLEDDEHLKDFQEYMR